MKSKRPSLKIRVNRNPWLHASRHASLPKIAVEREIRLPRARKTSLTLRRGHSGRRKPEGNRPLFITHQTSRGFAARSVWVDICCFHRPLCEILMAVLMLPRRPLNFRSLDIRPFPTPILNCPSQLTHLSRWKYWWKIISPIDDTTLPFSNREKSLRDLGLLQGLLGKRDDFHLN